MRDSVEPFINRSILVLHDNLSVRVAARAMHEQHVGCAMIINQNASLVGIVTDRDLSSLVIGFDLPTSTPISEVMTEDVFCVNKTASIESVVKLMEENGIRRVPIIEKVEHGKEKCIGIVSLDDLLVSKSVNVEMLGRVVKTQMLRRFKGGHHATQDQEHREHTFNRFNKVIASKTDVPRTTSDQITFHLLKFVVQMLPYTQAARFIAQLPSLFQEDLFDLPAGPNKSIDKESFLAALVDKFGLSRSEMLRVTRGFWKGLEEIMDPAILKHVLAALPNDAQELFIVEAYLHVTAPQIVRQNATLDAQSN